MRGRIKPGRLSLYVSLFIKGCDEVKFGSFFVAEIVNTQYTFLQVNVGVSMN